METVVTIDTDLLNKTMQATGEQTQRQLVENALRFYELQNKQGKARKYRGKLQWEGNLDELRTAKWSQQIPPSGQITSVVLKRRIPMLLTMS